MVKDNDYPPLDNLSSNIKSNLIKYATIRIDLKNSGFANDIELLDDSPDISYKKYPNWFSDEKGRGLILHSYSGFIHLRFKCINKGSLRISIRGIYLIDINKEILPIYININKLYVNGEEIVQNYLVWHNEPYVFQKDVDDSEIIDIRLEWLPMNKNSKFRNTLKTNNDRLKKENSALKTDNEKLNVEIMELKERNFDLMLTLEKIAKENYYMQNELKDLENSNNGLSSFFNKKHEK